MNRTKDFHKKDDGSVVNQNHKDFMRAKKRNFIRREQDKVLGDNGQVAQLNDEITVLKRINEIAMRQLSETIKRITALETRIEE